MSVMSAALNWVLVKVVARPRVRAADHLRHHHPTVGAGPNCLRQPEENELCPHPIIVDAHCVVCGTKDEKWPT